MKWHRELNLAKQTAKLAGERLIRWRSEPVMVVDSSGRDIKVGADYKSERLIMEALQNSSIYPILSEESKDQDDIDSSSYIWIVDPIDGTLNYTRGIPLFCVSIALWKDDVPILGVVYDVPNNELFTGVVGEGAWCNDKAIRVSDTKQSDQAILATGFPVNRDFSSMALQRFIKQVQEYKKVRLLGSAALSLAYLANGRVDAYAEENIMLWDVAAGITLVTAAGGWVSAKQSQSQKWSRNVICAANQSIL